MSDQTKAVLWTLAICLVIWGLFDRGVSRYIVPIFVSSAPTVPAHADLNQAFVALHSYVDAQYPGWTLTGHTVNVDEVTTATSSAFDVHLTKGTDSKVVGLALEEFTKNDGTKYWAVYPIPLASPTPKSEE